MTLWRLPAGVAFADAVAAGLLARHRDQPLALAETLMLLPTRRACRTLAEAFLRQSGGAALLLPRMVPLGDLDADELALAAGADVPPLLPARRRQLLLAQLVRRHQPDWPLAQCLNMAAELARLMDDITTEGADPARLEELATVQELAEHWQVTVRFLKPVFAAWPRILEAEGGVDAATRRNRLIAAQVAHWQQQPPATPVLAAGSTGSIPATEALLKAVLALPRGEVILPGLPEGAALSGWWDEVDPPHPFFGLKGLLAQLGVTPADLRLWGADEGPADRQTLLQTALLPAAATGRWAAPPTAQPPVPAAGLVQLDCAHEQEEATVIALKLRAALEVPGRTALLVTPDRMLGRRVAETLRRWGIAIDDSAGAPLAKSVPAMFLRVLLAYAGGDQDPVSFLALLKHPLMAGGLTLAACRRQARELDKGPLRGPRPASGIRGVLARLTEADDAPTRDWLTQLDRMLTALVTCLSAPTLRLPVLVRQLVATAEELATTPEEAGSARLWRGAAGEALAAWVADVLAASEDFPPLETREAVPVFLTLLGDAVLRPRQSDHPRLGILGPMEARLQGADVVVLGGLNEGVWPAPPAPDPWLSRPMRAAFGLRPAEQRIGQEAHDFYTLAAAPDVLLTRSLRQGGTPTVPARWLQRLRVVAPSVHHPTHDLLEWARQLDTPEQVRPVARPAPVPPLASRPRTLSVTQVETLLRDPYAIYAGQILRLKALDDLDAEPGVAERGTLIHTLLHRLLRRYPDHLPEDAPAHFTTLAEEELAAAGLTAHAAWWMPRLIRLGEWFITTQRQQLPYAYPRWLEVKGALAVTDTFTLTARADRIDDLDNGSALAILDYKTGSLSARKERQRGFSAQLPLEAAIARAGGFEGVPPRPVRALQFWRLTGGHPPGEVDDFDPKADPAVCADAALAGLRHLLAHYADPASAYPSEPHGAVAYSDYTHLARVKEWSVAGENDSEDTPA